MKIALQINAVHEKLAADCRADGMNQILMQQDRRIRNRCTNVDGRPSVLVLDVLPRNALCLCLGTGKIATG